MNERFKFSYIYTFKYLFEQPQAKDIGSKINQAFKVFEQANQAKLIGVSCNVDFNNQTQIGPHHRTQPTFEKFPRRFQVIRPIRLPSQSSELIGDTYKFIMEYFSNGTGKKGEEFYTTSKVYSLLSQVVNHQNDNRICDPDYGLGSLLIKAARQGGNKDLILYNQELNGSTW